ncbi:MAG: Ohr family peroxiredoxin [Chitinophagaceae bacterium]
MARLYTANVTSFGGRNGRVRSDDGNFELDLRPPGSTTDPDNKFVNPELLFAAAYSACFDSALQSIIRTDKVGPIETSVKASVSLDKSDDGKYTLAVTLAVAIPLIDRLLAKELMEKAHKKCPYSLAIKGNVEVKLVLV